MAADPVFFVLLVVIAALCLKEGWGQLVIWRRKRSRRKALARTQESISASESVLRSLDASILKFGVSAQRITETFQGLHQSLYDSEGEELEVLTKALAWAVEQEDYDMCARLRDRIAEIQSPNPTPDAHP